MSAPDVEVDEVYTCDDIGEAEAIRDEVLKPNGIVGFIEDKTPHMLPTPATTPSSYRIRVGHSRAAEARELLKDARDTGVISPHGAFVGG
jgi:hypothetical protein